MTLARVCADMDSQCRQGHLVTDVVGRVVGVVVLQQKVLVDRPRQDPRLQPAQSLQLGVPRGDGPHSHGVVEVHVFRR